MDSHILNSYHRARYGSGHQLLRSSSSGSSQTSPEYQTRPFPHTRKAWKGHDWSRNETINMTRSQETSSDEDENVEVQDIVQEEPEVGAVEENLVEGDDYDVIQVYAVDPDLDLEVSDDENNELDEYCIKDDNCVKETVEANFNNTQDTDTEQNSNLDVPLSNEDYFKDYKDILAVKDEPVVKDVDEYFIKEDKPKIPILEEPFLIDVPQLNQTNDSANIANIGKKTVLEQEGIVDRSITDTELEILPNIEDLRRFLLEDMTYTKLKTAQRSCSLPQSPMHNIYLDIDDSKTCLSFEDLDLDLSDLAFDNFRDKSGDSNKNDDVPRTLTDEDVNSFLIKNESVKKPSNPDKVVETNKTVKIPPSIPEKVVETNKSVMKPQPMPDKVVKSIVLENNDTNANLEDDLSQQDMEIENPVESIIPSTSSPVSIKSEVFPQMETHIVAPRNTKLVKANILPHMKTTVVTPNNIRPIKNDKLSQIETLAVTPKTAKPVETCIVIPQTIVANAITKPKSNVLDFCIEKTAIKKDIKVEPDDFVDVVSCHESIIPVLEANNLSSLLEQFEASEKLNVKPKKTVKVEAKVASLKSGMRLQDAAVQLNKTKMRHILMPSTIPINAALTRSPSPVHSDHDYCSTKKRYSLPNIKGGQSLLKPEVLSSNNRILKSRHRACKNKKITYHVSSDEEQKVVKDKIVVTRADFDVKAKVPSFKASVNKVIHQPTRNTPSLVNLDDFNKSNGSVIKKEACKASDTLDSQSSNGSIKLIIKNKSKVIINCDERDSQKVKIKDQCNKSEKVETKAINVNKNKIVEKGATNKKVIEVVKGVDSDIQKVKSSVEETKHSISIDVKIEPSEKTEDFYTGLFENEHDLRIPLAMQPKAEKRTYKDEVSIETTQETHNKEAEQPTKKKKLNLQEYKLRRGVNSNNSSTSVSPEPIFPEMPVLQNKKSAKPAPNNMRNDIVVKKEQVSHELPIKMFDPIRDASRKILMNSKKYKAEVMRRREEKLVMRKIPKVDSLELQPLISDAEMLKMVNNNMVSIELPIEKTEEKFHPEKQDQLERPQAPEYEEKILVSVGVNTDDQVFRELKKYVQKTKSQSPTETKHLINFKIKKIDQVMKHNVFDQKKHKKGHIEDTKVIKMDKERFKDITETLKSVQKQVDTKMSRNSLFASIKDVVKKKAPDDISGDTKKMDKKAKSVSPVRFTSSKTTIVRAYEPSAEHGEDKVILHLVKGRSKPKTSAIVTQTDPDRVKTDSSPVKNKIDELNRPPSRQRNNSNVSVSSEISFRNKINNKKETERDIRSKSEKRCRSSERYDKFRRSTSRSPSLRRRRYHSRSRSRQRDRFRRYRRSDSSYRRRIRSHSRRRRLPSIRREYRSKRSRSIRSRSKSKSRSRIIRSRTPLAKISPQSGIEKRTAKKSVTPPRNRTISESSTSSNSSSSSSSSSSDESRKSRRSLSYKREEIKPRYRRFSSEDREANTPVEERRIVFVGRLDQDITKSALRAQFIRFGPVIEVRLHSKEDGTRYGFVTFERARDAFSAVEAAATLPQYDVGFGGRRAFCRQTYADLDGIEAKYTESAFHGAGVLVPTRRTDHSMSFEQMLMDMKRKLNQRKGERENDDD